MDSAISINIFSYNIILVERSYLSPYYNLLNIYRFRILLITMFGIVWDEESLERNVFTVPLLHTVFCCFVGFLK
jgi:hypothetical protein